MNKNVFIKRRGHRIKRILHGIVKGIVIGAAAGSGRGEKGMHIGVENGLGVGAESAKQINQQTTENSLIYLIHYWATVPILGAQPEKGEAKPIVAQNLLQLLGFFPQSGLTWRMLKELQKTKMANRVIKHAENWSMLTYDEQLEELKQAYMHAGFIPFNIEVLKPPNPGNVIFPGLNINRRSTPEKDNEPDNE